MWCAPTLEDYTASCTYGSAYAPSGKLARHAAADPLAKERSILPCSQDVNKAQVQRPPKTLTRRLRRHARRLSRVRQTVGVGRPKRSILVCAAATGTRPTAYGNCITKAVGQTIPGMASAACDTHGKRTILVDKVAGPPITYKIHCGARNCAGM
jgi:hypothetical protein